MIFSLQIISIYPYISNSQSDQFPVGLIAQLVRALHRYRSGHEFEFRLGLNFFQAVFSQLLELSA